MKGYHWITLKVSLVHDIYSKKTQYSMYKNSVTIHIMSVDKLTLATGLSFKL